MAEQEMLFQKMGSSEAHIWASLSFFSEKKYRDLTKAIEALKDIKVDSKPVWNTLFHACHLVNDPAMQERIATQYSMKFGSMPPVFDISQAAQKSGDSGVSGEELNVFTMSKEESESYAPVFEKCLSSKKPLLIRFLAKKSNQLLGVTSPEGMTRLHVGISEFIKRKVPIYTEGTSVLDYMKQISPEKREKHEWELIFQLLLLEGNESLFEEIAVDYAVSLGVSPPSWIATKFPPRDQFFGNKQEESGKLKEQSLEGGGVMFELSGTLISNLEALQKQLSEKQPNVICLNVSKVQHSCWQSVDFIVGLHNEMAKTKKKIMLIEPFPLVQEMFISLGFPESNIVFQKKK